MLGFYLLKKYGVRATFHSKLNKAKYMCVAWVCDLNTSFCRDWDVGQGRNSMSLSGSPLALPLIGWQWGPLTGCCPLDTHDSCLTVIRVLRIWRYSCDYRGHIITRPSQALCDVKHKSLMWDQVLVELRCLLTSHRQSLGADMGAKGIPPCS